MGKMSEKLRISKLELSRAESKRDPRTAEVRRAIIKVLSLTVFPRYDFSPMGVALIRIREDK